MELNKSNIKKIILIIIITILIFWGLNHAGTLIDLINRIFSILSPFIIGFCFAFIMNVLLRPVEKVWSMMGGKKGKELIMKTKRPICLFISFILILGVLFIILFMLVPELQNTGALIIGHIPDYMRGLEEWYEDMRVSLSERSIMLPELTLDFIEFGDMLSEFLSKSGSNLLNRVMNITSTIFSGVFDFVLGIAFALFLLARKEILASQVKKVMKAFFNDSKTDAILEIATLANKTFTRFVTGQLTEALIIGFLCFLGMSIFSMPYAPLIAVLVGFTALIPVFGAFFGTAIGAFLILMVNPLKAIWFVLFIIILQQLEGNIIYPRVVGKSVGLPGIWVLVAVTLGGSLFGILGMLIGVPVCSVIYTLFKREVDRRIQNKE